MMLFEKGDIHKSLFTSGDAVPEI